MRFQDIALLLLSQAKNDSAVKSLKSAGDSLNAMTAAITEKIAGGGSDVQLAFAGMALLVALLTALLLLSIRRGSGHGHGDDLMARLDLLEIALREAIAGQGMSAEVKGAIGYFKQEVSDLRTMVAGMQHHLGALDDALRSIETRPSRTTLQPIRENGSGTERPGIKADGRLALGPDAISDASFFSGHRPPPR